LVLNARCHAVFDHGEANLTSQIFEVESAQRILAFSLILGVDH
jgi:hypothetical protein